MESIKEKANVCLYFLRDPRDMQPRYVGITDNPRTRWLLHKHRNNVAGPMRSFRYFKPGTKERYLWWMELRELGLMPVMDVVLTGLTKQQALNAEGYILQKNLHRFYQADSGRHDNLSAFRRVWDKCSEREKVLIGRIIASEVQPC